MSVPDFDPKKDEKTRTIYATIERVKMTKKPWEDLAKCFHKYSQACATLAIMSKQVSECIAKIGAMYSEDVGEHLRTLAQLQNAVQLKQELLATSIEHDLVQGIQNSTQRDQQTLEQFEKDFSKASSALSSQLKKLAEQIKKTRKKPPEEQEKAKANFQQKRDEVDAMKAEQLSKIRFIERKRFCDLLGMCIKELQNELDVAKTTLAFEAQMAQWIATVNSTNNQSESSFGNISIGPYSQNSDEAPKSSPKTELTSSRKKPRRLGGSRDVPAPPEDNPPPPPINLDEYGVSNDDDDSSPSLDDAPPPPDEIPPPPPPDDVPPPPQIPPPPPPPPPDDVPPPPMSTPPPPPLSSSSSSSSSSNPPPATTNLSSSSRISRTHIKKSSSQTTVLSGKVSSPKSAKTPPPPRGPKGTPPPPPKGIPPPPPPKGTPPPPPPPPATKSSAPSAEEYERPPPSGDRSALLASIQNFNKKGLKKTVTVDKSAPLLTMSKGSGTRGGGLRPSMF